MYIFLFGPLALASLCLGQATKRYDFDITWEPGHPDGNERNMTLINGQFPGPQIDLDFGDNVEIHVTNNLPENATIHFHGIEQVDTPWSDGVPGLSQWPIPPGGQFIYRWKATQWGPYWYHGHYRGQMSDGLYGPILIQPPADVPNPFDTISTDPATQAALIEAEHDAQIVMLSDWTKFPQAEYFASGKAANLDVYCVDSILVNGKGSVNCLPLSFLQNLTSPALGNLLQKSGQHLSDKGCTPMNAGVMTQGNFTNTDPSAIPYGLQDGCEATDSDNAIITVDASKQWVSLDFIQAASEKAFVVSIDEHPMWIYAVDGQYIYPQLADTFEIYNGARFSAFIQLDQSPGDYTIRVANFLSDQIISGYANLSYTGEHTKPNASTPSINYAGNSVDSSIRALDETVLVPFNVPPPAQSVDATYHLSLGREGANYLWTMTDLSSYPLQRDDMEPYDFDLDQPDATNDSLVIRNKNGTWVDLIIVAELNHEAPAQPPHPLHKHANKGYLIGRGNGPFNWTDVAEAVAAQPEDFNLTTAQYRDTFTTPSILPTEAWIVLRYQVVNPGAWILHCHLQQHLTGGMAITLLDGVDAWPTVPDEYLHGNGALNPVQHPKQRRKPVDGPRRHAPGRKS